VILAFTVLRRLDCVLEPSKGTVLAEKQLREGQGLDPEPFLLLVAGQARQGRAAVLGVRTLRPDRPAPGNGE
jgi:type I restriction enzyme M protein